MKSNPILHFVPAIILLVACTLHAETKKPFDRETTDKHEQLYDMSCIPSSVEMILKVSGRAPANYYDLQNVWKNKTDGNFSDFDGKTINGLTFHKQFGLPRDDKFPHDKLLGAIHDELKAGRVVAISLRSGSGWHIYIIYAEDKNGEFLAVSKLGDKTIEKNR